MQTVARIQEHKPASHFAQEIQKSSAIAIVLKDRSLTIAPGSHVVECIRILNP